MGSKNLIYLILGLAGMAVIVVLIITVLPVDLLPEKEIIPDIKLGNLVFKK